ncbi:MAG: HAMP domain-containing sensor histidine kinase [Polaromonas sp.]|nr:HAMP domain-containing sensor histidine kinase [Polaromonas sp.]
MATDEATRARTALLTRISHDLRALLTPIMGFADIIIQRNGPSRAHALAIVRSSRQLLAMMNGLIAYARSSPQPRALQLPPQCSSDFSQGIARHAAGLAAKESCRAVSDLLSRVSRELRLPVDEILVEAGMIASTQGDEAAYRGIILRSASHLQKLIDDLIDYSQAGKDPSPLLLNATDTLDFLNGIAVEAGDLAKTNCNRFNFRMVGELPQKMHVDARRLRQVLLCVLDNAAKFTREGMIVFQVEVGHHAHASVSAPLNFVFMVHDTGPGIAAWDLPKVFDPFWRSTDGACSPGPGMGLATARYWTQRMGGEIAAVSTPGQGTTMRVAIPLKIAQASQRQCSTPQYPLVEVDMRRKELPVEIIFPGPDVLADISDLIRMGALSDLGDWAQSSAARNAQWSSFADAVAKLAANGDLKGLSALQDRLREASAGR